LNLMEKDWVQKHYSKITLWKLRKRISFSYHRRELIVYVTSFFVLWYQQSKI
jgi:hypothetical protein